MDDNTMPEVDNPPKDGVFRHLEDHPLTEEEIRAGNEIGERIDVENDEDNGLR